VEVQIPQDAGVRALLDAIDLRPQDAALCLSIGEALEERGALDDAERAYRRAVAIDGSIDARRHLGMLLLGRGAGREALECLRSAVELLPDDPDLRVLVAIAREECSEDDLAIAELSATTSKWPQHVEAHRQLGRILGRTGSVWACAEMWRAVVQLTPDDPEAKLALALALSACGEHDQAISMLEKLVADEPGSAERSTDLGMALLAAGRGTEARATIDAAIRMNPDLAQARCALALVHHESGDLHEAAANYRRATELAPDWVVPWFNLGLALYQAWDLPAAREALQRAELLLPDDPRIRTALEEVRTRAGEHGERRYADDNADTMSGDLAAFSLPDLLEFLRRQRASGTLILDTLDGVGLIVTRRGKLAAAASPSTLSLDEQPWSAVSPHARDAMERAARDAALLEDPELLGRIFARDGVADRVELRRVMETNALKAMEEMIRWKAGRFSFRRLAATHAVMALEPLFEMDPRDVLRNLRQSMESDPPPSMS
jgi:tetratricopeptide (TPR) repeat protein